MSTKYFLGANSGSGFTSLYSHFPTDRDAILHIIKGGPGTGKSGFMRAIGRRAEELGMDVEYVLCSGDPGSLDGVYIPSLRQAWVDGTAPHVLEPGRFGVDGDYVNLGRFCRTPLSTADGEKVNRLTAAYRSEYDRAYSYLVAAAELRRAALPPVFNEKGLAAIRKRISGILSRRASEICKPFYVKQLYLGAFTCNGFYRLTETVSELCKQIYRFESKFGGDVPALKYIAEEAEKRGLPMVVCPSPLDPEFIDAVLLPCHSLAFVSSEWQIEAAHTVQLDRYAIPELRQENRTALRKTMQIYDSAAELAIERLRAAKELHDELEAVYYQYMDFSALTEFTEAEVSRIFQ